MGQALVAGVPAPELPTELRPVTPPPLARETRSSAPSSSSGRRPPWTDDADAPCCELCRAAFTVLQRRHHCRRCGRCVCAACSPEEGFRPLPELGYEKPCRQCKVCVPPAAKTLPA